MQDALKLKEQVVTKHWLVNISVPKTVCISKYLEISLITPKLEKLGLKQQFSNVVTAL